MCPAPGASDRLTVRASDIQGRWRAFPILAGLEASDTPWAEGKLTARVARRAGRPSTSARQLLEGISNLTVGRHVSVRPTTKTDHPLRSPIPVAYLLR